MAARDLIDLQISTLRGVAENIDVPVLGKNPTEVIKSTDSLLALLEFNVEGTIATCKDVSDRALISRTGYVQVNVAPTSPAWRGLLFWVRENGGLQKFDRLDLKVALVTGGAAAAHLALTGLAIDDKLIAVFHISTAAEISTIDDITHLCEVHAAAVITCSIDTANDQLWVFYHNADGATAVELSNLRFALVDGAAVDTDIVTADKAGNAIAVADSVIFCGHITTKAAVTTIADLTSECHATHLAGSIQMETTDTTNDQLFIIWQDVV